MANVEKLARELALTNDKSEKKKLAKTIFEAAHEKGVYPWSINDFYMARGRNEFSGFTVPAIKLTTAPR